MRVRMNTKSFVLGAIKSPLHLRTRKFTLSIRSRAPWGDNIGIQSAPRLHLVSLERSKTREVAR
jgi:hypothetical protein